MNLNRNGKMAGLPDRLGEEGRWMVVRRHVAAFPPQARRSQAKRQLRDTSPSFWRVGLNRALRTFRVVSCPPKIPLLSRRASAFARLRRDKRSDAPHLERRALLGRSFRIPNFALSCPAEARRWRVPRKRVPLALGRRARLHRHGAEIFGAGYRRHHDILDGRG